MIKPSQKYGYPRRQIACVGAWNTIQLDRRAPYTVLCWSIAFGGFGHLLLDKYFRGLVLIAGEIFFNAASRLNLAIFYTITMKFDLAEQVLDRGWFMLYLAVYTFAIFDSFHEAVEINKTYELAVREDAAIQCFACSSSEFSHLYRLPPWLAMAWSAVLPGSGCFMTQRSCRALCLTVIWVFIAYLSGLYPALIHTLAGNLEPAKAALNIQWFLNIPSLWFYSVYTACDCAVSNNKLYRRELSHFLKNEYQSGHFVMPGKAEDRRDFMYVFSVFEHSPGLEMAMTELRVKGISKEAILAVSMDGRSESGMLLDKVYSSDCTGMLALPMILGMIFTFFGAVFGFQLTWGPILWAVIGAAAGFLLGLAIRLAVEYVLKKGFRRQNKAGVILVIECEAGQAEMIKEILWSNTAMGVSIFNSQHCADDHRL